MQSSASRSQSPVLADKKFCSFIRPCLHYRTIFALIGVLVASVALCDTKTKILDAKIEQVTDRGYVLKASIGVIPVEDDTRTKFWAKKSIATRDAFHVGDAVNVRIKVDAATTVVREMADMASATWLARIRKDYVLALINRIESSRLEVTLEDQSKFSYAVSDKVKVTIGGESKTLGDVKTGQKLYVKAQLTSALDTKATAITDRVPQVIKKSGKKTPGTKAVKIDDNGTLSGSITSISVNLAIFDIQNGPGTLHITYSGQTKFMLNGAPSTAKAMQIGDSAEVNYRRDSYGRIVAQFVRLTRN